MRVEQPEGTKGSLKWIQRAIALKHNDLEMPILERLNASTIGWRSPIATDNYAEYRDLSFLECLGLSHLGDALRDFWPPRGPQWDALGIAGTNDVLLVEAKAHVRELCSGATSASSTSRAKIASSLDVLASYLKAKSDHACWMTQFYQLANRLAHLHFLRSNGVSAWLVLVNFIGDGDMNGPQSKREWDAAYEVAWHVMGLNKTHALSRYVIEIFPDVSALA